MQLTTFLKHIGADDTGATAVEYGLIVSLIVIAMVGALESFGESTINMWEGVEEDVDDAVNG